MYKEGEDRYLKDLDWVSIVKSIRELKALTRIILNQQQRQILAFERESVLPSSKYLDELNANQIQNKVPFEYGSEEKHQQYSEELEKIIEYFSNRQLSDIDNNIINELADEITKKVQETSVATISIIGSSVSDQKNHKWD